MISDKAALEQHPLFPSGQWEGFYIYQKGIDSQKYKMAFHLDFVNGHVRGGGYDNIGGFDWSGSYDTKRLFCEMTKQYTGRHAVWYQGEVDENGIWGIWLIPPFWKGGFHIWPKGLQSKEEAIEASVEKRKLIKSKTAVLHE